MPKFKPLPSQQELHRLFDYSVVTGELYWKVKTCRKVKIGSPVGYYSKSDNYKYTKINKETFAVHRLIWVWVTGEDLKELEIDHKDVKCTHNAWHNLRQASHAENLRNKSDVKGFTFDKRSGRWLAQIQVDKKRFNLGRYDTEAEARAAYEEASLRLHGEFSSVR